STKLPKGLSSEGTAQRLTPIRDGFRYLGFQSPLVRSRGYPPNASDSFYVEHFQCGSYFQRPKLRFVPVNEKNEQARRCVQHVAQVGVSEVLVSLMFDQLMLFPPIGILVLCPSFPRDNLVRDRTNGDIDA